MPVPKAPQDRKTKRATSGTKKYALTSWGGEYAEDLEVPSGQLCRVRRPGAQGLLEAGVLHSLDTLTAIVDQKHVKRVKGRGPNSQENIEIDADGLAKDPESLINVLHLVDRVVTYCVLEPKVEMTPDDVTNRKQGVVYCDTIDLEDRMFIFNFAVGGTRSVERFRREGTVPVGSVEAVADDGGATE